ncbi:hypothetical protein NC652_034154 [Populus alba x Populus x berolinensis]|nr:hypothetical protein NC652_034154 [Populus alba x Populus x berolinensis]
MAEIHPPETHPNNGGGGSSGGGGGALTSSETVGSKRQRRPSVRLGEIGGGDQLYESQHHRRTAINSNKQWKQQQQSLGFKEASKSSKTRALTNLSEFNEILDGDNDINLDSVAIGSWRLNHSSKKRGSLNSWWFLEIDSRKCNLSNEVWSGFQLLRSTEVARSSSCLFVVYSSAVFNTLRYSKVVCGILCELRLRKSYLRGNIKPITKIRIRPVK